MVETGWIGDELPAGREARELADILAAPPTWAEREAARAEQADRDEQLERARERADDAETRAWLAGMHGQDLPDVATVLATRTADPERGNSDGQRRRRAREILRQHDLEDVITGGSSGVVFDANIGIIEPGRDMAQRSEADFDDAETARLVKRTAEDREYIQRISRSRRPFARRSAVTRSESCQHCIDQNVDDETSFLLHSDPQLRVPVTPPGPQAETDRRQAEADRLEREGFTPQTSRYAGGLAVR